MSLLTAAQAILAEAGTPLTCGEIMRRMIERKLFQGKGKTPDQSLRSEFLRDIKKRGSGSTFVHVGTGLFGLRSSAPAVEQLALPQPQGNDHAPKSSAPTVGSASATQLTTTVSFADAAEQVLNRFGAGKPMHYREITRKALEFGLIKSDGQTPEATLYTQLLREITGVVERGGSPRFIRHGKGYFGLSRWLPSGLVAQIDQHNAAVRNKLHARLHAMPSAEFEALIGKLLVKIGFEQVSVTGRSGDGGIDVRGTLVVGDVIRIGMAAQAKRWKGNVQAPTVRDVRGGLGAHDHALIITTSDFSQGARDEAQRKDAVPVALMNGDQLVALLIEHEIGVHRTSYDLLELGEQESE